MKNVVCFLSIALLNILLFIQQPVLANTISGTVWVDANADGIRNVGEAGIPNVTVRLFFDNNEDGFVERMIANVQSDLNGNYILNYTVLGKYQVGIDPLSLPEDKYRLTTQDALENDAVDSDVSPHTFRSDIFKSSPGTIDIGILQGNGELIYIGTGTNSGQPVHQWLYQDIYFEIQDTGSDPNDSSHQAIISQWLKWYVAGDRILQEADILPNYLDISRYNRDSIFGVTVKNFYTVNGLGSYAAGRTTTSSGIPATSLLNNPYVLEDHMLMLYETTRGSNPIWKYRANWPFGGRLTHHALTAIMLLELGGTDAFLAQPNITPWTPGRDHLEELRLWELLGENIEDAFPVNLDQVLSGGELVNHYSLEFTNPEDSTKKISTSTRGIQTAIVIKVLADMGREKAIEVLHNMSTKSWYAPSQEQALIYFKQAVNDATDGAYANDFVNKWGFPSANTYDDTRANNAGNFVNQMEYKWDCKPHNYDTVKIRSGYSHLSDRTTLGFAKWIDSDSSEFRNLGARDFLATQADITYPNNDAYLVIGEGVSFSHQLPNGYWIVDMNILNNSFDKISSTSDEIFARGNYGAFVSVQDGELNFDFNGQVFLSEMVIRPAEDILPTCPEAVSDDFNYSFNASIAAGNNGGSGFIGDWAFNDSINGSIESVPGSLNFIQGQVNTGNKLRFTLQDEDASKYITRDSKFSFINGDELWMSCLIRPIVRADGGFWIRPNNRQDIAIGKRWGSQLSIDNNGSSTNVQENQIYKLVVRYRLEENQTVAHLWVNRNENFTDANADATKTVGAISEINHVGISMERWGNGVMEIDDLQIGCEPPLLLCEENVSCEDNDPCTENDVYNSKCNCTGTLIDADNNNICDNDQSCLLFMNLNNTIEPAGIYQADDFITSTSKIGIASNGPVSYQVGDNYILLENGFSADGAVNFIAKIEDCDLAK